MQSLEKKSSRPRPNSFDLLLLDHSLEVLSTVYTARNLHW